MIFNGQEWKIFKAASSPIIDKLNKLMVSFIMCRRWFKSAVERIVQDAILGDVTNIEATFLHFTTLCFNKIHRYNKFFTFYFYVNLFLITFKSCQFHKRHVFIKELQTKLNIKCMTE